MKRTRARIVEAAVRALAEGYVLHVGAPYEAEKGASPPKPEVDLTAGPCHLRGFSVEDYSPTWVTVGRSRRQTRRNEREDFATPSGAIRRVVLLLSDRTEYLRVALGRCFADEIAAEADERDRLLSLWITEMSRTREAHAWTASSVRDCVGGGSVFRW